MIWLKSLSSYAIRIKSLYILNFCYLCLKLINVSNAVTKGIKIWRTIKSKSFVSVCKWHLCQRCSAFQTSTDESAPWLMLNQHFLRIAKGLVFFLRWRQRVRWVNVFCAKLPPLTFVSVVVRVLCSLSKRKPNGSAKFRGGFKHASKRWQLNC